MKAVRIHNYGETNILALEEAPQPVPASDEILIRVHAAGVNPVDVKIRAGYLKDVLPLALPATPGCDVSGVVETIGEQVTEFQKGDEVYAMVGGRMGAYAEFATAKSSAVARKPQSINHEQAAAVPLAALSAWQSLFDHANLSSGQKVLIHAAAGGIGTFAVQFAKWKGATVIATASAKNQDFLRQLGADVTIDYLQNRFEDEVTDADVVIDAVGGDTLTRSFDALKPGGTLVVLVEDQATSEVLEKYGAAATIKVLRAQTSGQQLAEIARLIDAGTVKVFVDEIFPLAAASQAHEKIAARHTRGKIVLQVAPIF